MSDENYELKGFLYQRNGAWILADQPNLKSCCLNENVCILMGDFSQYPLYAPLKVRGTLEVTESGRYLTNVEVLKENRSFPYWSLVLLILIVVLIRKSKKRLPLP